MPRYIDAKKIRLVGIPFEDINHNVFLSLSDVQKAVEQTPTADVEEVVRGKWKKQRMCGGEIWFCSECGTVGERRWKRCPLCEAKMDKVGGDNNGI